MKVYQYLNRSKQHPNWIHNWGDAFCADMMSKLSGQTYQVTNNHFELGKIVAAGSVMSAAKNNDLVWGTGCIMPGATCSKNSMILAVRGPLTRKELLKKGIACPEVYGDPALLLPLVYQAPIVEKTHKYGLIPHYIDHHTEAVENARRLGIKIIDICQSTEHLLRDIHSVEVLMSSSLHGLILADAYGIPNIRISITGNLVGKDFKFEDYYASVDRRIRDCHHISLNTTMSSIESLSFNDSIQFNENKLLDVAPWV